MPSGVGPTCITQRLNPDCLALIFYEDVLAEDPHCLDGLQWEWPEIRDKFLRDRIGDAMGDRVWALTRLAHVCRRWREIALSLSPLWASLVAQFWNENGHNGPYKTIVERARGYPLSFVLPDEPLDSYRETQLVENFARFDTIMLNHEYTKWPSSFSGNPAHLLRIAVFITDDYDYEDDVSTSGAELAPLEMPVATHLAFDGLYMPFLAPQLTTLVICLRDASLSAQHICDILRRTPLLENLNLIQYRFARGGGWPSAGAATQRALSLPRLTYLKIWGSTTDITSFLLDLNSPKDITLNMTTYDNIIINDFKPLFDALRPYMNHPSYDHLTVCDCREFYQGHEHPPIFSLRQGIDGSRRVAVHVNLQMARDIMTLYTIAFERLIPGQVRTMTIEDWEFEINPHYPSSLTNEPFHHYVLSRHVEELHYHGPKTVYDLFSSLYKKRWGIGLLPDFLIRYPEQYPALRRIHVRGGSRLVEVQWPSEQQLLDMKDWLDSRARAGISLDILHLDGQYPAGAPTSLETLGEGIPVVDNRQAKPASPAAHDSDESYTHDW